MNAASRLLKGVVATVLMVALSAVLVFLLQRMLPKEPDPLLTPAVAPASHEPMPVSRPSNRVQERLKAIEERRAQPDDPEEPTQQQEPAP